MPALRQRTHPDPQAAPRPARQDLRRTLIAALLAALPASTTAGDTGHRINTTHCCVARDDSGRIKRSAAARRAFAVAQPCPATGRPEASCPGWRIDHIIPLKRCGPDTPANMQWLTVSDWKAKSRWE